MKIRRNDMVEVIAGNDRGKRGRVLRVIPDKNRAVVQGVNLRWKHLRKSQQNPAGGRIRRETAIHVSNLMLYDEGAGTRTRIGYLRKDGKKVRVGLKTGREIGTAAPQKAEGKKAAAKKEESKSKES